jgi:hypothetical protein
MREWTRSMARVALLTAAQIVRSRVEREVSALALARQAREAEARRQARMERLRQVALGGELSEVSEVADGE